MKKKPNIVPVFLFHIAQGFYDTGYHIAIHIKNDRSVGGFQRLATAVVNFSFSIELYIKGLNAITSKLDLKGHQFWNLYIQLPLSIRSMIEQKYDENKQKAGKELTKYRIRVYKGDEIKTSESSESMIDDNSTVKELLHLHNDSFDNWRYLYEINDTGYEYEYDFRLMNVFIKALIEVINEINADKTPSLTLTKKS